LLVKRKVCLQQMASYQVLKKNNFGRSEDEIEELAKVLHPHKQVTAKEHAKLQKFLGELAESKTLNPKDLAEHKRRIRKKLHYDPSNMKLRYAFFRDILWREWAGSPHQKTTELDCHKEQLTQILSNDGSSRGNYGLVNLTLVTEPLKSCQYQCAYCPHGPTTGTFSAPISYLPNEPAVARGALVNYHIVAQFRRRIMDLCLSGVVQRELYRGKWYTKTKVDVRLAGGTFHSYPEEKRDEFIQQVYYAARTIDCLDSDMPPILSLDQEKEIHISNSMGVAKGKPSGVLIVGLSIETRPDEITMKTIQNFNRYHLTWVEMGVQHTDNTVLRKIKRGHTAEQSELALAMLKSQMGSKVLGHIMPDLPGSTPEMDLAVWEDHDVTNNSFLQKNLSTKLPWFSIMTSSILFALSLDYLGIVVMASCVWLIFWLGKAETTRYSLPHMFDHLKVYPTMRLPYTKIEKWGKDKWDPYSEKENGKILMDVLCKIVLGVPPWIRFARIMRDFQEASEKNHGMGFTSDTIKLNTAQLIQDRLEKQGEEWDEIKSREIKRSMVELAKMQFKLCSYRCSMQFTELSGTEFFGTFEAPEKSKGKELLVGLFRLRLNDFPSKIKEVGNAAILREVHVYGGYVPVGHAADSKTVQHRGYGKKLVKLAEIIAYNRGYHRMVVISAPGTMGYYAKCGYTRAGRYMAKPLTLSGFAHNLWVVRKHVLQPATWRCMLRS
jgi:histone acetyltransferase (RNA polymerase elongator complex component)